MDELLAALAPRSPRGRALAGARARAAALVVAACGAIAIASWAPRAAKPTAALGSEPSVAANPAVGSEPPAAVNAAAVVVAPPAGDAVPAATPGPAVGSEKKPAVATKPQRRPKRRDATTTSSRGNTSAEQYDDQWIHSIDGQLFDTTR